MAGGLETLDFVRQHESPPATDEIDQATSLPVPSLPRKRPLRTYGKRKQLDLEPEAQQKKRKLSTTSPIIGAAGVKSPALPPLPILTPLPSPKRSGIMRYFKPMPSSSASSPSMLASDASRASILTSDATEPLSTPPSSPPGHRPQQKRIKRRLTTRPDAARSEETFNSADNETPEEERPSSRSSNESASAENRHCLQVTPESLNRRRAVDGQQNGGKAKAQRAFRSPSVQTTLSLSSKPGFTECKICDTVYNVHNQKDIKYHARRHALVYQKPVGRP